MPCLGSIFSRHAPSIPMRSLDQFMLSGRWSLSSALILGRSHRAFLLPLGTLSSLLGRWGPHLQTLGRCSLRRGVCFCRTVVGLSWTLLFLSCCLLRVSSFNSLCPMYAYAWPGRVEGSGYLAFRVPSTSFVCCVQLQVG